MAKAPYVDIRRLRKANEDGYTQRELAREIFDNARRTGTDISQVRGRRRPTEKFVDGEWVKV